MDVCKQNECQQTSSLRLQQNPWCVHLAWRLLTGPAAVARLLDDASPWRGAPPRQVRVMRWRMDFTRAAWGRPRRGPHDTELPVASSSSPLWCAWGPDLYHGWDLWHALVAGIS